jgi:hypothetical protein
VLTPPQASAAASGRLHLLDIPMLVGATTSLVGLASTSVASNTSSILHGRPLCSGGLNKKWQNCLRLIVLLDCTVFIDEIVREIVVYIYCALEEE